MSEATTQVTTPETSTTTTQAAPATVTTEAQTSQQSTQPSGLEFLPEAYRNDPSFTRYKSAEELAKGFKNLEQFVGKKEIVQGLKVPGDDASPEEVNEFYKQLGRPEAADKYTLPEDVKLPEGFDLAQEKTLISGIAFELGLSNKQATALYKKYAEETTKNFTASQTEIQKTFDQAVKTAFGDDYKANLDLAKKGAAALGGADKLNLEEVSNPHLLKALAMLGKDRGEDSFENGSSASKESILEEAKRIQASPEYVRGDKAVIEKVQGMYKRVYG